MKFTKINLNISDSELSSSATSFPIWVNESAKKNPNSPFLCLPTSESLVFFHKLLEDCYVDTGYEPPAKGFRSKSQLDHLENKLLDRTYGRNKYKNVLKISEEIIFQIACRHPFTDGNKRTAFICARVFTSANTEFYLGRDKRYSSYRIPSAPKNAIERAKKLELIADWNEAIPSPELRTFLMKEGIRIKKKVSEQHIRQYITKFLQDFFIHKS